MTEADPIRRRADEDLLWERVAHRYGIDQRDVDWEMLRDLVAETREVWQPIETAPESTQVLAWDDERGSNPAMKVDGVWLITYDDAEIRPTYWQPWPILPAALRQPSPRGET